MSCKIKRSPDLIIFPDYNKLSSAFSCHIDTPSLFTAQGHFWQTVTQYQTLYNSFSTTTTTSVDILQVLGHIQLLQIIAHTNISASLRVSSYQ